MMSMSVDPCPVCSATPRSQVLCHRVGDYICDSHCVGCKYLHERLWRCRWQGGPEDQEYSAFELHDLIEKLKVRPLGDVRVCQEKVERKIIGVLVENKEPRDRLPYYWIRLEAVHRVLTGGDAIERKSDL